MATEKNMPQSKEQLNVVIVGHVDHGKSTLIGRLLADTNSLPEGKLEQVKATCKSNAKPFEYAFLLDALKDEQSQGITIDAARCFFKTKKRHYIIFDAPGHIEFLKNMVTGAAKAEAGLLLIDAKEGVQENSRRHGFLLSLLGVKQIVVVINKMDLVDYSETVYQSIKKEYEAFLRQINIKSVSFIPISAFQGDNLTETSTTMPWYTGPTVLSTIDSFEKEPEKKDKPFRFPVQDVYKFTQSEDDRRIVAGTIRTGEIKVGDEVVFYPSKKESRVKSVEAFNAPKKESVGAGDAIGFTLDTQLYIKPGELMCKKTESAAAPYSGTSFKANMFWLSKRPLLKGKRYQIKLACSREAVYLTDIINVMDASELSSVKNKQQVDRHDVAECVFQTLRPLAFDRASEYEFTGRFVIVDHFEIAGGGIITGAVEQEKSLIESYVESRNQAWHFSEIDIAKRMKRLQQKPKFVLLTGPAQSDKIEVAKALEKALFESGKSVYFLGISNKLNDFGADSSHGALDREDTIRRLGELAHFFTDSGLILISTLSDMDDTDAAMLKTITAPNEFLLINFSDSHFHRYPVDLSIDQPIETDAAVERIMVLLKEKSIISDYCI